jgi:hydroxymethylbilane synthase
VIPFRTEGDIRAHESIHQFGDKGVFVARIERALLQGEADIAVHSLKDLPGKTPDLLDLIAFLPRADPRDVFVSASGEGFEGLAAGSRIGTASPRRIAQLSAARPDLEFYDIRGNVDTRMLKLHQGEYDAIVLAAAGLIRLQKSESIIEFLSPALCTPAPGQGIVALQVRAGDPVVAGLRSVGDEPARLCAFAERTLAAELKADCTTPFGALATVDSLTMTLTSVFADASGIRRATRSGPSSDPEALARSVAESILEAEPA